VTGGGRKKADTVAACGNGIQAILIGSPESNIFERHMASPLSVVGFTGVVILMSGSFRNRSSTLGH